MRARLAWCALVAGPLFLGGCATYADYGARTDNRAFGTESPGSVTVQPPPPVVVQQPVVQAPLPPVVVQPGQSIIVAPAQTGTVVVPGSQVVQVEDLEANEVRAQTIYANKIEASEIRGAIHQTGAVRIDRSVADLKTPTLVASVLYADTIKANRVTADHIFVRQLDRR